MTIVGEEEYSEIRKRGKPVIFMVWHGRIFLVPYFFRRRKIMPLISPSGDGEIPAQIIRRSRTVVSVLGGRRIRDRGTGGARGFAIVT